MKRVAILITVYNRKEKTIGCLRNLYAQTLPNDTLVDIYITDGGSSDGTVDAVKTEFKKVNIEIKDGVFWNRGMYYSWERAIQSGQNYDYFLWINDDVVLVDDCIFLLIEASRKKGNSSIIVGATVGSNSNNNLTYGGRTYKEGIPLLTNELIEVDYFNGNIVLIPATIHATIGNLDFYFTHSKGDFDYGLRARKAGFQIYQYGNKALGICDKHERIDRWCDPKVSLFNRLKMLYRPNGMPPNESFHLEKKNSIVKAIFHYFTIHIRCIFPQLWIYAKKSA